MKKFLVLIIMVIIAAAVSANPPSDILFKYRGPIGPVKGMLTVNVIHNISATAVKDPAKHFIKEVVMRLNGKEIDKKIFKKQENAKGQKVVYILNLKPQDVVTVTATCSIKGSKTVSFSTSGKH